MHGALWQVALGMRNGHPPPFEWVPELMMASLYLDLIPSICLYELYDFTTAHPLFLQQSMCIIHTE